MRYTLQQWRGVKGITQAELAKISGVGVTKIAVYETMSADDLRKIHDALALHDKDSIVLPKY